MPPSTGDLARPSWSEPLPCQKEPTPRAAAASATSGKGLLPPRGRGPPGVSESWVVGDAPSAPRSQINDAPDLLDGHTVSAVPVVELRRLRQRARGDLLRVIEGFLRSTDMP